MNLEIKNTYSKLELRNLEGLLVSLPANISYLTKSISRDSYLLVSRKKNVYFTDSRYYEEAKINLKSIASIKKSNGSVFKIIADAIKSLGLKRIGFEERHLAFGEYKTIKQQLSPEACLIPTHSLVEDSRKIKTQAELEKISQAIKIAASALEFVKKFLFLGRREIEIAAELERFIRYRGACGSAFEIIVASGPNSSFPHHITSQRKLRNNEPVLIDIGVDYLGYKSDLTRVFFLGKISATFKRTYNIVLKAQQKALELIKPGTPINKVDGAARQYIAQSGLGRFFNHSLGHGIGREVHEEPHISSKNNQKLSKGMIFTVEPAIYLPGKFGIRIEDIALVTEKNVKVLSGDLNKSI